VKQKSNHLGRKIKKRRIEMGWTQDQLAKASGYSRVHISRLENSRITNPGIETLQKISYCLGIKLDSLCS
jgi:transcriptional regulator with XRE-family HTH domain